MHLGKSNRTGGDFSTEHTEATEREKGREMAGGCFAALRLGVFALNAFDLLFRRVELADKQSTLALFSSRTVSAKSAFNHPREFFRVFRAVRVQLMRSYIMKQCVTFTSALSRVFVPLVSLC